MYKDLFITNLFTDHYIQISLGTTRDQRMTESERLTKRTVEQRPAYRLPHPIMDVFIWTNPEEITYHVEEMPLALG